MVVIVLKMKKCSLNHDPGQCLRKASVSIRVKHQLTIQEKPDYR